MKIFSSICLLIFWLINPLFLFAQHEHHDMMKMDTTKPKTTKKKMQDKMGNMQMRSDTTKPKMKEHHMNMAMTSAY